MISEADKCLPWCLFQDFPNDLLHVPLLSVSVNADAQRAQISTINTAHSQNPSKTRVSCFRLPRAVWNRRQTLLNRRNGADELPPVSLRSPSRPSLDRFGVLYRSLSSSALRKSPSTVRTEGWWHRHRPILHWEISVLQHYYTTHHISFIRMTNKGHRNRASDTEVALLT